MVLAGRISVGLSDCPGWFAEAWQEIKELMQPGVQLHQSDLDKFTSETLALRAQNVALQTKLDTANFQVQFIRSNFRLLTQGFKCGKYSPMPTLTRSVGYHFVEGSCSYRTS